MGREMRFGVILAVMAVVLPGEGAMESGTSPGPGEGQTYPMTWCAGGPGRRDGMNAGMLRVFEIELLDAPPAGAEKLPTANTRFGVIQFADEGKSRFVCGLRETSRDGRKDDSFFIDRNRNGILEDGEVLQGTPVFEGLTATEFGAMDLMLEGSNGPRKHRIFVHTNKYGPLYLTSHCYTRGRIRLGEREVEATLLDYNCDGRYACGQVTEEAIGSLGPRQLDYDTISWDAGGDGRIHWTEQHFVGSYVVSGDKAYRIDCSPDGLAVTVTPLDLLMGRLRMPPGYAFVRLVGPLGPFNVLMPNAEGALPAGTYRVDLAAVWETSDTSTTARFRKIGLYFEKPWTIRAGTATVIEANELIVTDADEQRTKERMAAHRLNLPEVRSLLNAPLGDLTEFGIDPGDTVGKRILLCFYDSDQRPSRHVVAQLVQRHDELKRKGLVLAGVGTSSPHSQALPFVVGRIEGDPEPVKAKWGVRSLPWLILADEEHIVRAEGFSLGELEGRIGQMRNE